MELDVCRRCQRHVRVSESVCPFCQAELPQQRRAVPAAPQRLGRLAWFLFGASVSACGSSVTVDEAGDESAASATTGTTQTVASSASAGGQGGRSEGGAGGMADCGLGGGAQTLYGTPPPPPGGCGGAGGD